MSAMLYSPQDREPGELYGAELHRVISEARLFAGTDTCIPGLCVVHLESTGTHLVAVATNRFMMGASAVPYIGEVFTVDLPLESADLLIAAVKPRLNRQRWAVNLLRVEIGISPQGRRLRVRFPLDELRLSLPTVAVEVTAGGPFSKWRTLLQSMRKGLKADESPTKDTTGTVVETFPFAVNPDYLRKFAQIKRSRHRLRIYALRPNRGILVDLGTDDFVGVIMPMRYPTDEDAPPKEPSWLKEKKR